MTNCTEIIHSIFYENVTDIGRDDTLLATKIFCDHLIRKGEILFDANLTVAESFFKSFCCTEKLLDNLCSEFAAIQLNFTLKLNCPNIESSVPNIASHTLDDVLTLILMTILIPIGLTGNLLILYAILKMKCLPIQTGYFLCSLAVADIGVIFEFIGFFVYHKNDDPIPERVHMYLLPSLDIFFAAVSLLQVTLISIERAVAVTWPLKYPSYISAKRAKHIVQIIWIISFIIFTVAMLRIVITSIFYESFVFYASATLILFIPLVTIVVAYTFIIISVYQNLTQERQRLKVLTILLRSNSNITMNKNENERKNSWTLTTTRCREIKVSINVAMIVLPFLLCWGFFVSAHVYERTTGYRFEGMCNWILFVLPFGVSSLNPMLYLLFTRSLRKSVKSIFVRNARSRLSRTELSVMSANGNGSRRTSSLTMPSGRKLGRDFSYTSHKNAGDEGHPIIY